MAKNHIFTPQTIDADDEDTDICPVCEGLCICLQKPQRPQPSLPPLKIKLTVPQSLIAKHLLVSSSNPVQTTSDSVNRGYLPKKRGRPPKSTVTPSRSRAHPTISPLTFKSRPSSTVAAAKIKQNSKARAALAKRAAVVGRRNKEKSRKILDDEEDDEQSSLTSQTDVDMDRSYPTSHFPTFVSASALESLGSSSDSDSDSDNDSSGNQRDREREKARTKKDLLGDDPLRRKLGHPINKEWVIRSRKTSVDRSEAEGGTDMDVDSESDEDDQSDTNQEEGAEDDEEGAGAETTLTTPLLPFLEPQDSETTDNLSNIHPHHHKQQQRRPHFVRLGKTGWSLSSSEDEESAFDAELFFRYLYDSSASSSASSSVDGDEEEELTEGQDNDDGPLTSPALLCPPRVESLPFELAESWDGGVVFTNGEGVGSGDVGVEFVERSGREAYEFRGRDDSDLEMDMRLGMGMAGCASCLEDGYLEEDEECEGDEDGFSFNEANDDEGGIESYSEYEEEEGGSGDTTDEDLVGSDSLPNQRAMSLFKLPLPVWGSVSAVDPLSLVSSRPRELEMMEVVEGVGEKRRRGKGKNKGKGRMRRETREKGGRERRKEGKKRREELPSPLDILEGRGNLWGLDERMDVSGEEDEEDTASIPFHRGHKVPRSPRTPTPTSARSPTTPVPTTPALSITTSFTAGPRKGVFVVPPGVSGWTESGKRKGKAREKATVVIGEDRKGKYVPSPHPRKRAEQSIGGGGDGDVVEQLLRRHLVETLGTAAIANMSSDATATVTTVPLPPTPHLGPPFSLIVDDIFSSSHSTMKAIQLDDVLDAEFLKDVDKEEEEGKKGDGEDGRWQEKEQEVKGGLSLDGLEGEERMEAGMSTKSMTPTIGSFQGQGEQASPTPTPSDADLAADAAAVKSLSRWDFISVGAFRQAQQQARHEGVGESPHHGGVGHERLGHGHVRTPGSSTDYGNAIKKSGKFALGFLWRGGGGTSPGKGAKAALSNSPGTGPGAMRRTPSGGMIGSIHAKKRKLMMSSSSTSVMKEPLVLPASSIGAAGGSNVASSSTTANSHVNTNASGTMNSSTVNANPNVQGKTRKEARRERKLQKRIASQPYNPHSHSIHPHSHQHHHQHMYHTHYHHPNAKTRGVASAQRLGGWFVGGGSGSGGGGAGWGGPGSGSGSSGGVGGGGFGGLGF